MSEATDTRPVIKEVWIEARPETVYPFFTEPEKMTRWLCSEATADARPGGENVQVHYDEQGTAHVIRGEFVALEPPARLVWTWGFDEAEATIPPGASTIEVTFTPEEGGTRVRLVHSGLRPGTDADHERGWTILLGRLADALA